MLYDICQDKNISVHTFILKQAQLSFSRWLPPILFDSWVSLIDEIYAYPFANSADEISWKGGRNGKFSTKFVYVMLTSSETGLSFKSIWKAKIPHRIKLFLWLLENQVVLTKDNLLKRNRQGDPLAISAPPMRILITCSSCVLWLKLSGGQWPYAWVLITFPRIFFSIRSGLHTGYLLVTQSILSAWVQFAGLSGKNEMKSASKINH